MRFAVEGRAKFEGGNTGKKKIKISYQKVGKFYSIWLVPRIRQLW